MRRKRLGYIKHTYDGDYLFTNQLHAFDRLSTRQYARIVKAWVTAIGLDPAVYGTLSAAYQGGADLLQN